MNIQSVGAVVTLAVGMIGVGIPAYQTHKSDQAELASQQKAAVDRAVAEQKEHDRLWRTLDEYKRHFQFLDETLPARERATARAVFTRMQIQQDMQPAYDKATPVILHHGMKLLSPPPVAADAPAEEKPQ